MSILPSFLLLLSLVFLTASTQEFFRPRGVKHIFESDSAGSPLKLSEYLKKGRIDEARSLSLVTEINPNITSYAGYLTVDEKCDSNLFFWYFPSQNNPLKDPVSVWLQGGPGSTSFFGLLTENGPYNLNLDGSLELRKYSWNRNSSVIYIDNPVGTGYSYTTNKCYAKNQTIVGQNLLTGLEQFFQIFPEISQNPFYLTGESYAGKYVPAAAYAILTSNSSINLQGVMIGNGLVDPRNQQNYSSYAYQLGLVDANQRDQMADLEERTRTAIDNGNYLVGSTLMNQVLGRFSTFSGYSSLYNYLYDSGEPEANVDAWVSTADVSLLSKNIAYAVSFSTEKCNVCPIIFFHSDSQGDSRRKRDLE